MLLSFSYCTWFIFRRNEFLLTREKQMQCQKLLKRKKRVERALMRLINKFSKKAAHRDLLLRSCLHPANDFSLHVEAAGNVDHLLGVLLR